MSLKVANETLKYMSLDNITKISMILNSENANEFGKWYLEWKKVKIDNKDYRIDYLEKRIETIERSFESKIAFLEKLILEKL